MTTLPRIITCLLLVTMGLGSTPFFAVGGDRASAAAASRCGCSAGEDACEPASQQDERRPAERASDLDEQLLSARNACPDSGANQNDCCPTGCHTCFRSCCAGLLILQPKSVTLSPGQLVQPYGTPVIGGFSSRDPAGIFHPPRS